MTRQYALGIDLHKRSSYWVLLDSQRNNIWSQSVLVEPEVIKATIRNLPIKNVSLNVAIEPTCGYRWVCELLEKEGCSIHLANPYKMRLIAESRKKTDAEDAKTLAEFLLLDYLPESFRVNEHTYNLRELVRVRHSLIQSRTKLKCRIQAMLTEKHPRLIKKELSTKELKKLYTEEEFSPLNQLILSVFEHDKHISEFDQKLALYAKESDEAKLLMTIPNVGVLTAMTVVSEVADFKRFKKASNLAGYAGLTPKERSSGENIRFGHISKMGSGLLRTTLIETAMRMRESSDPNLFDFYSRVKGSHGAMKARVALARKIITIMWYMVKNNQPFLLSQSSPKLDNLV